MSFLPALGNTPDTQDWTDGKISAYSLCTFIVLLMFLLTFALAFSNFYKFVLAKTEFYPVDENSSCDKTCNIKHPLMLFYILVFSCITFDIISCIMAVKIKTDYYPFLKFMPPTLKALIGIDQIWVMVEFIFQFKLIIELIESRPSSYSQNSEITVSLNTDQRRKE